MTRDLSCPRLPVANAGGLTPDQRAEVARWTETAPGGRLRRRGLWTDLHDRLAAFPPYIRAQEHSAQIPRATLQRYEEKFREGRINLLNCSTTMEMGVDIADVRLVVNSKCAARTLELSATCGPGPADGETLGLYPDLLP